MILIPICILTLQASTASASAVFNLRQPLQEPPPPSTTTALHHSRPLPTPLLTPALFQPPSSFCIFLFLQSLVFGIQPRFLPLIPSSTRVYNFYIAFPSILSSAKSPTALLSSPSRPPRVCPISPASVQRLHTNPRSSRVIGLAPQYLPLPGYSQQDITRLRYSRSPSDTTASSVSTGLLRPCNTPVPFSHPAFDLSQGSQHPLCRYSRTSAGSQTLLLSRSAIFATRPSSISPKIPEAISRPCSDTGAFG